jgi:GNAT superfamily N-acetyltransferase
VCFFVAAKARRHNLTEGLLRAAVDYARENGARIVEGMRLVL